MTEGYINSKYKKELLILCALFGFDKTYGSEYMLNLNDIIRISAKMIKRYKKVCYDQLANILDEHVKDLKETQKRMYTLNSKEAKDELRNVVLSKQRSIILELEQIKLT